MADNLIFPIGFDLEAAVSDASKEWDGTYAAKLEKALSKRPIKVKLSLDTTKLDDLDAVKKRLAALKIEPITPETKTAIRQLTSELNQLAKALSTLQKYTTKNAAAVPVDQSRVNLNAARAQAQAALAAQRTAKAEDNLAAARLKAARAANVGASAARKAARQYGYLDGYLCRLIARMSVLGAMRFASNFFTQVRDVTAEFELQRVSLGAIIRDQERANELFEQIKSFALLSPLKIMDLTKYTKQVAAYGIETEKLFDTTKMLADISVGLGVDMSRLTLFYGQVFATGYLRASEVRQATEAGIPLVDKLAEKLSEANGKLISAAQVMDLISKRAISFEMVEEVFKDMTSAGGMFYNMQVKQSQTLFGMWSKLGDAASVMYNEIGNTDSVNAGMKLLIKTLENLMRNWETSVKVLDTIVLTLGAYVVVLKSTRAASAALTQAEAMRLAIQQKYVVATPKLIAAIIGETNAKKLSTAATRAHTVAVAKSLSATTLLTKGFWKMAAALLANPYAIAIAGLAGITAAIVHAASSSETAKDKLEALNNSVAAFKNFENTNAQLMQTYDELTGKANLLESEQAKLKETTHELAKAYPGAILAINDYGESIDLAAGKLRELNKAEREARIDETRRQIEKNEKLAAGYREQITNLQEKLRKGTETKIKGGEAVEMSLSAREKSEILKEIDELLNGKGNKPGLTAIEKAIVEAKIAIGDLQGEAAVAALGFTDWKKTLADFVTELDGVKVRLFMASEIEQLSSLDDALDKVAKTYKENAEFVEHYEKILNSSVITAEERAKIESEKAVAVALRDMAKSALEYYNMLSLLEKKTKTSRQADPRINVLNEMASSLKEINKEYADLEKKEGPAKALKDTQRIYKGTFDEMRALAKKYKFSLPAFGVPTDTASLNKYLSAIKKQLANLPDTAKQVLSLQMDIDKLDIDELQKRIKEELERLSGEIKRAKTVKEFYEDILSTTGDVVLSMNVAMSIYGGLGSDGERQMADYVRTLFSQYEVDIPVSIFTSGGNVNYSELEKYVLANKKLFGDGQKELLQIAQDGQKAMADRYKGYLKDLEKAKTYSDKRIALMRTTAAKIEEIQKSELPDDEKQRLIVGYNEKEAREAASLQYEAFKETPLYTQMFEDLENASVSALTRMRDKLVSLKGQWKDLDPTQLKELQSRLNEIDEQLASRRPFGTIADALKQWSALNKAGHTRAGDNQAATDAAARLADAEAQMLADERAYQVAAKTEGVESKRAKALREIADASKENYDNLSKTADETAKQVGDWKRIEDALATASDGIGKYQTAIDAILGSTRDIMEEFGASDEDLQFFDDLTGGFDKIMEGGQQAASSVASFMSGDILGGITSAAKAIGSLVTGFSKIFSSGRIHRANEELERQADILKELEQTYTSLEKTADKLFGTEYLENYRQQLEVLQAQAEAYKKQADAERSKGKKADADAVEEYENQVTETAEKIAELQDNLAEHFTGSSRADVARQMAQSWIDARVSMSDTFAAIKEDYQDLIKNMIVEGAAARVIEQALTPLWESMDEKLQSGDTQGAIDMLINGMDTALTDANNGMNVLFDALEARGYDMKSLIGDVDSSYSGIAKNVAGATSEEINTVAAIGNTLMYYVSPIPRMDENLSAIRALMETEGETAPGTAGGWSDWQKQAMDNYNAIARNTADTVVECRRAAVACEAATEKLNRAMKTKGAASGFNVFIN